MSEVEGMNLAEERLSTWPEAKGMDMTSIHMVEVEGKGMTEERPLKRRSEVECKDMAEVRPSKQRSDVDDKDMVEEHSSKQWPEVESMDIVSIHMVEDTMTEVERVEREHRGMMLVKHQINDGAKRNQRTHQEREIGTCGLEGCWGGHT
jgi:hypothetical protein